MINLQNHEIVLFTGKKTGLACGKIRIVAETLELDDPPVRRDEGYINSKFQVEGPGLSCVAGDYLIIGQVKAFGEMLNKMQDGSKGVVELKSLEGNFEIKAEASEQNENIIFVAHIPQPNPAWDKHLLSQDPTIYNKLFKRDIRIEFWVHPDDLFLPVYELESLIEKVEAFY